MIAKLAGLLKDATYIWGALISVIAVAAGYYHDCQTCFEMYFVEMALGSMTLITSMIVWLAVSLKVERVDTKVNAGLNAIQTQLIKSEVDRLYIRLKDSEKLSDDEMRYLIQLDEQRQAFGVNSFTQRKLEYLLSKGFS